jgi:Putative DNA-binding domain
MTYLTDFETLTLFDIEEFVARGQEENLHLDFKLIKDASLSSTDDKKNFACALSGFANSSGGLIVWGVDARKNSDGVDCAIALLPIEQVSLLVGRLNSLTGEGVDPSVNQVLHRAIETEGGRGYGLTVVPESETGPHMAKLGENRYYKRIGDGFYKMEHYDIADMFGRRRRPKLAVFYRIVGAGQQAVVHLGLRNDGRATARAPFFAFETEGTLLRSQYGLDGNGNEGLQWLRAANSGLQWAYGGGMDFALHPAMAHEVACLSLGIPARPAPTEDVVVRYVVACEDQPLERSVMLIPISELR